MLEEFIVVAVVCFIFVFHLCSAFVAIVSLPRGILRHVRSRTLSPDRTVQVVGAQVRSVVGIPTDCVGQRTGPIFCASANSVTADPLRPWRPLSKANQIRRGARPTRRQSGPLSTPSALRLCTVKVGAIRTALQGIVLQSY